MKNLIAPCIILAAFLVAPSLCQAAELVRIKGGQFLMGSPAGEPWRKKDEAQHSVTLRDFYIARYEVTQAQYRELTGSEPGTFKGTDLPVENVTWFEAVQYCNALSQKERLTPAYTINGAAGGSGGGMTVTWDRGANGYRLPTEAEWEYAARAGTNTPFNTGENITPDQANYYSTYPYHEDGPRGPYRERTVPVGSFQPNAWGLYAMHGNVWEWCWDRYGAYSPEAQTDPAGPAEGTFRVNRGGGWNDFAKHIRSAYRAAHTPSNRTFNIGFRVARNAE